ncbi:MAG: aldehyde dehydrogenase family protein, partial [Chloroflexi bacterium]|nr:aldehyde dehydrogenase family protein [Chloroflexota bacterium]
LNPYDGSVVDTVPRGTAADVDRALNSAVRGAGVMAELTGFERYELLHRTADLIVANTESLATCLTREEGKIISEARIEVERAAEIIYLSAEEAKRLDGEVIPLEGGPGVKGKFGFTMRVPCGVVAAVTPFNFPLHLVCHKVGPALAGGNAVVVKPASDTPLMALRLVELLLEAGVPAEAVHCVTGSGAEIGDALVSDPRVRKISFTGSRDIGERICKQAGIKKVTMELGSNAPVIVMPDADMDKVRTVIPQTAFANAGQVCISTQRVIAPAPVYDELVETLVPAVAALSAGDPLDPATSVGPMIRESDAARVGDWIDEAVGEGAELLVGGGRSGQLFEPTLLAGVNPEMRVSCEELFGPAMGVTRVDDVDQAIELANDSIYGLSAAIFTQDIDTAMRFARSVDSGNIHINWGSQWRTDLMPYGGLKDSGMGKEGPKYAVEEMTEYKLVVIHD